MPRKDSGDSSTARKPTFGPLLAWVFFALTLGAASSLCQTGVGAAGSEVTFVEVSRAIDLAEYVIAWPGLDSLVARLRSGERDAVKAQLQLLAAGPAPSDGALNLLAQLEREDGNLDDSQALIARAISSNPKQHRHHFQQAMLFFARLSRASGLGRWIWQQRTRDAYQRAFDLDPRPAPYRYYLVYTFLHTPAIAGGDKDKALRLTSEGIDSGQKEFYLVRGDVHRLRREDAQAFADYDRAIVERMVELGSFLAAGRLAIEKKDWSRAKRYLEWAVRWRPESAKAHEGLGDYLAAVGDSRAAVAAYQEALRIAPESTSAREKLVKLRAATDGRSSNRGH